MTPAVLVSLFVFIGTIVVAIIGYFLRKTMDDLDITIKSVTLVRKDLDVLTNDHSNKHVYLTEKFDDLKDSIIVLTKEIKELTSKIK